MSELDFIPAMYEWLHSQNLIINDCSNFNYCYFYGLAPSLSQQLFPSLVSARFRKRKHSSCRKHWAVLLEWTPQHRHRNAHTRTWASQGCRLLTHTYTLSFPCTHTSPHSRVIKHTLPSIHKAMLLTLGLCCLAQIPAAPWLWQDCSESTRRSTAFTSPVEAVKRLLPYMPGLYNAIFIGFDWLKMIKWCCILAVTFVSFFLGWKHTRCRVQIKAWIL